MPDAYTSQLYDGARNVVVHLNNLSDGTGQVGVTIIDPATLTPNPGARLVLWRCSYDIRGGGVTIYWDAPTPRNLLALAGGSDDRNFSPWGGIKNDAVAPTGLVKLSTAGFLANSGYSITLEFKKLGPANPGLGALLILALAPGLDNTLPDPDEPVIDNTLPEPPTEPEVPPELTVAPVNIDVPYLSGIGGEPEGQVGYVMTCTMGNWEGEPTDYAYQFKSDDVDVEGTGTGNTYVPFPSDVGHAITCVVTATNAAGLTEAPPSNAVMVVATTTTTRRSPSRNRS